DTRHPHLADNDRFGERDRKSEAQVGALALEQRVGRKRDGNQQIPGAPAAAREPLALEPDLLAIANSLRDLDLDVLAVRKLHALLGSLGGFRERDCQRGRDVVARRGEILLFRRETARPPAAGPAAASTAAEVSEHVLEDVLDAAMAAEAATRTSTLKSFGPEAERFERALAAEASSRRRAKALESLEARLAFGVDLAPVKSLTLVGIAHDLIPAVDLAKAVPGLRVLLV